ncbi:MAG: SDR family oxidoreductase [Candidatus Aenigmarchaeota archaeon]|nr:SDR family oxidoreductase [Candidatus Aenigmarchaeota archaeon]
MNHHPDRFKGKVAVVTGSSRGIGKAIAIRLAAEGAYVVVNSRKQADADKAARDIAAAGGHALAVAADVSKAADVHALLAATVRKFKRLDVFVNNAGIFEMKPFLQLDEASFDRMLAVGVKGVYLCGQAAARQMIAQKTGGNIVNIASIAGLMACANAAHYGAAKAAVLSLTKTMAAELAHSRIRVNAIAPGVIDTDMVAGIVKDPSFKQTIATKAPFGIGKPEDIAAAVAYIASDDARYVTGETLVVDGGWTIF